MAKFEKLASTANPLLKQVRRAARRGGLTEDGCCIAETFHLLDEALRSGCEIRAVLASESAAQAVGSRLRGVQGVRAILLPDRLSRDLSTTEASQGVLTLVRPPAWTQDHLFHDPSLVVVLDGLQDPGNAGAVLRAAEAFGASGVLFLKGAANPYNPKAVRAAAGSLFRVPLLHGLDASLARGLLAKRKLRVYAAMPGGSVPLDRADLSRECAIVIGGEARGVSEALLADAIDLRIPTAGVESLNAAVAAGILLYEARRQRTLSR